MKNITGRVLCLALVILIAGCNDREIKDHRFQNGDVVRAKIDNRRGMIVSTYLYSREYKVRFGASQMTTKTRILSPDEPIDSSPYSLVRMREYELISDINSDTNSITGQPKKGQ